MFALTTAVSKTYIEIGGSAPIKINNTYLLEQNGFSGISLEFNEACIPQWNIRKNKVYFELGKRQKKKQKSSEVNKVRG